MKASIESMSIGVVAAAITAAVAVATTQVEAQNQSAVFFDLSGEYEARYHEDFPERVPGTPPGDYSGLPINDAARSFADAFDASILSLPEHQCKQEGSDYAPRFSHLRIWKEVDPETQQLIAFRTLISWMNPMRTIWMDGRPHPSEWAPHTWQGFSTGYFEGDTLVVKTTHLKFGIVTRNLIPRSDIATMTERWARHGDVLTLTTILYDPIYLTEPLIRTTNWVANPRQQIQPYPCDIVEEVADLPRGYVPHYLPGTNPFLEETAKTYGLPLLPLRGGANTMYPEYRLELQAAPRPQGSR